MAISSASRHAPFQEGGRFGEDFADVDISRKLLLLQHGIQAVVAIGNLLLGEADRFAEHAGKLCDAIQLPDLPRPRDVQPVWSSSVLTRSMNLAVCGRVAWLSNAASSTQREWM